MSKDDGWAWAVGSLLFRDGILAVLLRDVLKCPGERLLRCPLVYSVLQGPARGVCHEGKGGWGTEG